MIDTVFLYFQSIWWIKCKVIPHTYLGPHTIWGLIDNKQNLFPAKSMYTFPVEKLPQAHYIDD
jgi:hypothetical protein